MGHFGFFQLEVVYIREEDWLPTGLRQPQTSGS